jgi:4'-phosphopantetheinyl transferase
MEDGEIAVWCRPTDSLSQEDVERMTGLLSDDERCRQNRFVFERDRRDFAAAHALVRQALSTCGHAGPEEWRFRVDARGKPHIDPQHVAETPLTFNLSHTRGIVACVIARDAAVGVDVERVDSAAAARDVASQYFAPSEVRLLERCASTDYATRFVELWTLKEAYIKAVGAGLHLALDSFAFAFSGRSGLSFSAPPGCPHGEFMLLEPSADTRLAIAVLSTGSTTGWRITFRTDGEHATVPQPVRWSYGMS